MHPGPQFSGDKFMIAWCLPLQQVMQTDIVEAANHYPRLNKKEQWQKMTAIHYISTKSYSSSQSLIR